MSNSIYYLLLIIYYLLKGGRSNCKTCYCQGNPGISSGENGRGEAGDSTLLFSGVTVFRKPDQDLAFDLSF